MVCDHCIKEMVSRAISESESVCEKERERERERESHKIQSNEYLNDFFNTRGTQNMINS